MEILFCYRIQNAPAVLFDHMTEGSAVAGEW